MRWRFESMRIGACGVPVQYTLQVQFRVIQ